MRVNASTLLKSLHDDLSHVVKLGDHSWSIDNSHTQVACYRLYESLLKKFNQDDNPSVGARDAALEKFLAVNQRMSTWSLSLNHVQPDWELVGALKLELANFFDPLNDGSSLSYSDAFNRGRAGPGASLHASGMDFYTKMFGSNLSATSSIADTWRTLVLHNPQFREAFSHPSWVYDIKVVDRNKLSFVNKNHDIARTICTEPSINMWMQLGVGDYIHSRLRSVYGIDFSLQPDVNRCLARLGSLNDHLVTIDLESASDSLGMRMLAEILPQNVLGFLSKLRSPMTSLPDGSCVPLNMISTMGNGFTFPLQTLIFAASCAVCYNYLNIKRVSFGPWHKRNFAVFGDDIIVDKRVSRLVLRLLSILGFVVNDGKTFVEGPFRESCGVDCFSGVNVRPVYLKRLRTLQDAFVAINRLTLWSARHLVPLRNTVAYIVRCFPNVIRCPVPPDEDDAAGLKLPRELIDTRKLMVKRSFGLLRYVASVPSFRGYRVDTDACRLIDHPKNVIFNPEGVKIAYLGGYITGERVPSLLGRVSIRQMETRFVTKRRVSPNWGYLRPDTLSEFPDRVQRFLWAARHVSLT